MNQTKIASRIDRAQVGDFMRDRIMDWAGVKDIQGGS